jgi:cytoskeletal protein RodZ
MAISTKNSLLLFCSLAVVIVVSVLLSQTLFSTKEETQEGSASPDSSFVTPQITEEKSSEISEPKSETPSTETEDQESTVIEPSSPTAQEYADKAALEANAGNYNAAIAILEEGIAQFPEDKNLPLTKEYYELQARKNGQ